MCPECGQPMVILEFNGIEVDHCVACGGTWLDTGDLEDIDYQASVEAGSFSALLDNHASHHRPDQKGKRRCPRCNSVMFIKKTSGAKPVEIDSCPAGHGYWFDRGELKHLVACPEEGEESALARFFTEILRHELS